MKKMKKMKNLLTAILLVICVASTTYYIYIKYNEYQEQKKIEELKEYTEQTQASIEYESEEQSSEPTISEEESTEFMEPEEKKILPQYVRLYAENADLYGWLKIEGTVIDYPVMYTPESPEYYLHKDWNKEDSNQGLLFADARTDMDETENTIIYGHCMKNRTMFGSLKDYKDSSFYDEHKYIEFDTIYEKATYEIISVSKGIAYYEKEPENEYLYYKHTELDTEEAFDAYIQNAKNNAYYETGVTAEYGDKLITLSTCDYWTKNARLYIVAKKIS